MTIPSSLYTAIAKDILNVEEERMNSFQKEANSQRDEFLSTHGYKQNDFSKDKLSKQTIDERLDAAINQIEQYYALQANAPGGLSTQMKRDKRIAINDLEKQRIPAIQNRSIDRTMNAMQLNPDEFKRLQDLSTHSKDALKAQYGKETGIGLGGAIGAGLGYLGGSLLPKNTKGIAQKTLGGLAGAGIGAITGGSVGSYRDEKNTGFNHEDALKPYEIADRIQQRNDFLNG